MAIYMDYGSGKIKGDVTQGTHKDWIEVSSFEWGMGRAIHTKVGSAKNREASEPAVSEVIIHKPFDSASVLLCQEVGVNAKPMTVKIDFCKTEDKGKPYIQITLTDTLISGYRVSSGGDRPSESLTLNFTKIEYSETEKSNKVSYDLTTAGKA